MLRRSAVKKVLIISSFPPKRCGIGTYAQEHLVYLKRQGCIVYTQSFADGSAANYHFSNLTFRGLVKATLFSFLARVKFDEVYLHFTNGLVWPLHHVVGLEKKFLAVFQYAWIGVLGLVLGKRLTFIGHEINTNERASSWLHHFVQRMVYGRLKNIHLHTEQEKKDFLAEFGFGFIQTRVSVVDHHRFMAPKFVGSKMAARKFLGLPTDKTLFLCIGFIQEHKGFDDVVQAIQRIKDQGKHLYVVGSIRVKFPAYVEYFEKLKALIDAAPQATLVDMFVSDREFDLWLTAADWVVLPYREIWSSGVGARAKMIGTSVIMRSHPNLLSQFSSGEKNTYQYDNVSELIKIMEEVGPRRESHVVPTPLAFEEDKNKVMSSVFKSKRFLFIMPCFGESVRGGAESFIFAFVSALVERGAKIEVWSSDSAHVVGRDHSLAGIDESNLPFVVKRFPANCFAEKIFDRAHRSINREGWSSPLTQWVWKKTNLHGMGMEDELHKRQSEFDVIHLFHYLLGSSHRLSGLYPKKMLLHPFIHDEAPLRKPLMRNLFTGVMGVTCNTHAAWRWASKAQCGLVPGLFKVIGNGVEPKTVSPVSSFDEVDSLQDDGGYVLFVGRMISEKNLDLLFCWHEQLLKKHPRAPSLLCIGEGPMVNHEAMRSNPKFKTLGWLEASKIRYAMQNALALIQLSKLESFSLVLMESWLEGVPCIVHSDCLATAHHIKASGGGFAVDMADEYEKAVIKLQKDPEIGRALGAKGHAYVESHYSWDEVCYSYVKAAADLCGW